MSQRLQAVESAPQKAPPHPPTPDAAPAERLSAIWDGEADALTQAPWGLGDVGEAPQALWREYHLIGAAMREGVECEAPGDLAFARSVMGRLQTELHAAQPFQPLQPPVRAPAAQAANDSVFRWKALASVATMAAVLSVGWQWGGGAASGPLLATAEPLGAPTAAVAVSSLTQDAPPVVVQTAAGQMLRDPQLEALMAAHRQLGGVSALQMPAGFVRNATFEVPAR